MLAKDMFVSDIFASDMFGTDMFVPNVTMLDMAVISCLVSRNASATFVNYIITEAGLARSRASVGAKAASVARNKEG